MTHPRRLPFAIPALLVLAFSAACAQQPAPAAPPEDYVRAHYTKYEFRIPMRDGKRLFTAVYVPKDDAGGGPYPFLMERTPYSVAPYGEDKYPGRLGPSDEFEKSGYIFVYQDVRGRWMSEGDFVEMRPHIDEKKSPHDVDDASDTYDTIEFLLKHVANNNGKVGIWGISYPGFYTSASIIDSHPALVAASPQAPMTDLFLGDDSYHGGAFMLSANFSFYAPFFHPQQNPQTPKPTAEFDFGTPDSYKFYLQAGNIANLDKLYLKGSNWLFNDQARHWTYDGYWQARDLSRHMKNVHCAVLVVGGWFDAEDLSGPYKTFNAIAKFNPETPATLVEGPWVHGGWARGDGDHLGDVPFNSKTGEYFRARIQFPFFEHYLKGRGAAQPKAVVFETGTNVWRTFDAWPPKAAQLKTLYFHAGGKLSFDPPAEVAGVDEYTSDPAHPVPFVGYTTDTVPQRYMVDDQRFAGTRPDVLVYQTDPLEGGRDHRRTHLAKAEGRQLRHGLRLRREADRRLPGRLSRPGQQLTRQQAHPGRGAAAHGRLSAVAARRTLPSQVPLELGEARAADAGKGGRHRLHHARPLPYLPPRPPHHGSGAEFMVPAH
jgi:putative CocE/NonD family hydrolase